MLKKTDVTVVADATNQVGGGINPFNFIINPTTGARMSLFSSGGKALLKNLINLYKTGGSSVDEKISEIRETLLNVDQPLLFRNKEPTTEQLKNDWFHQEKPEDINKEIIRGILKDYFDITDPESEFVNLLVKRITDIKEEYTKDGWTPNWVNNITEETFTEKLTCGINPTSGRCKIGMPNDKKCKISVAKDGNKNCTKVVKKQTCGINPTSGRCKIGAPNNKKCKLVVKSNRKNCTKA